VSAISLHDVCCPTWQDEPCLCGVEPLPKTVYTEPPPKDPGR